MGMGGERRGLGQAARGARDAGVAWLNSSELGSQIWPVCIQHHKKRTKTKTKSWQLWKRQKKNRRAEGGIRARGRRHTGTQRRSPTCHGFTDETITSRREAQACTAHSRLPASASGQLGCKELHAPWNKHPRAQRLMRGGRAGSQRVESLKHGQRQRIPCRRLSVASSLSPWSLTPHGRHDLIASELDGRSTRPGHHTH